MPRSKRDRKISLTKTSSKGRALKEATIDAIREALESYESLYIFSFENMRSNKFKDFRIKFRDSRFFLGKNKVMQKALGIRREDEYRPNLRFLSKRLTGQVGLLATNRPEPEVREFFENFRAHDYAKAGSITDKSITINVEDNVVQYFPVTMYELFKKLGLNLCIQGGQLKLLESFVVAEPGVPITPEQAKLMKHLSIESIEFKISLLCHWSDGNFNKYAIED